MRKIIYGLIILCLPFFIYNAMVKNNDLTIYGNLRYAGSIERQPIDLINMLEGSNVSINFIGNIRSLKDLSLEVWKTLANFNFKLGHILINERSFHSSLPTKYHFNNFFFKAFNWINPIPRTEQIWISYSMFESDKLNDVWVEELNKNYDAVVVPDPNLVPIYKNSGVNIPIFTVPLSVDYKQALVQPLKKQAHVPFIFGNMSGFEDRKNTIKLIQTFKQAFGNRQDVRLLINSHRGYKEYLTQLKNYLASINTSNIDFALKRKSADEYNQVFNEIDCYVSLSKGEGFSVQPREAMARGIPVIISDAIAQKTIAESGLTKAIKADIPKPAIYNSSTYIMGNNFDVNIEDAVNAMLDVYNNYQKYLDLAPKAREWASQYSYDNIKPLYLSLVKPKKVILGDRNEITKEYLMTNSQELYNKWKHLQDINALK